MLERILYSSVVMLLAFGAQGHWFKSCPDLIFLPCIFSFVYLLHTLFIRWRKESSHFKLNIYAEAVLVEWFMSSRTSSFIVNAQMYQSKSSIYLHVSCLSYFKYLKMQEAALMSCLLIFVCIFMLPCIDRSGLYSLPFVQAIQKGPSGRHWFWK